MANLSVDSVQSAVSATGFGNLNSNSQSSTVVNVTSSGTSISILPVHTSLPTDNPSYISNDTRYFELDPEKIFNIIINRYSFDVDPVDARNIEGSHNSFFLPITDESYVEYGWTSRMLILEYSPRTDFGRSLRELSEFEDYLRNRLGEVFRRFYEYALMDKVFQILPNASLLMPNTSTNTTLGPTAVCCSSLQDCGPLYDFLYDLEPETHSGHYTPFDFSFAGSLFNARKSLSCPIYLLNTTVTDSSVPLCNSVSSETWKMADTDENLQKFRFGGVDSDGIRLYGLGSESLSHQLRAEFLGPTQASNCSLETLCETPQDCDQVGSLGPRRPLVKGSPRRRSDWAFNALTAIANINRQLFNQFEALQSAGIEDALAAFTIDDYFPEQDQGIALQNIITGLSTVLSVASGFIPVAGPAIGALGTIASSAGTYLERSISANVDQSDPNIAQKRFAPIVRQIFRYFSESLDNVTAELFRGERIDGKFDIYDMMRDGTWADQSSLTRITHTQEQLFLEITSRAINGLWKTPTSNKMWVLFVDLDDDETKSKCMNDTSGPKSLRYCGDGGVYYAYNFVETGAGAGYRYYPWGADKMKFNLGIDPAVSMKKRLKCQLMLRLIGMIVDHRSICENVYAY